MMVTISFLTNGDVGLTLTVQTPEISNFNNDCSNANTTCSENESLHNSHNWEYLFLSFFVVLGMVGNLFVCTAVYFEKKLQTVTNYLLMSLAVADLHVSIVVMPCGILQAYVGYWPFGVVLCDIWLASDVMMCTSSIMHMCVISLDRYLSLRQPLKNRSKSCSSVVIKITLVWILSLLMASPIIIMSVINKENILHRSECGIFNHYFLIYGSLGAYFIPLIIMFIAYTLTIKLLRTRANHLTGKLGSPVLRRLTSKKSKIKRYRINNSPATNNSSSSSLNGINGEFKSSTSSCNSECDYQLILKPDGEESPRSMRIIRKPSTIDEDEEYTRSRSSTDVDNPTKLQVLVKRHRASLRAASIFIQKRSETVRKREINTVKTERKAVKVLGAMFGIFFICWTPFFSINFTMGVCQDCNIKPTLFHAFLWLGYVSSTLNPIIYTIFNNNFKRTFLAILTCKITVSRKLRKTWKFKPANQTRNHLRYEANSMTHATTFIDTSTL